MFSPASNVDLAVADFGVLTPQRELSDDSDDLRLAAFWCRKSCSESNEKNL